MTCDNSERTFSDFHNIWQFSVWANLRCLFDGRIIPLRQLEGNDKFIKLLLMEIDRGLVQLNRQQSFIEFCFSVSKMISHHSLFVRIYVTESWEAFSLPVSPYASRAYIQLICVLLSWRVRWQAVLEAYVWTCGSTLAPCSFIAIFPYCHMHQLPDVPPLCTLPVKRDFFWPPIYRQHSVTLFTSIWRHQCTEVMATTLLQLTV
jgi:hypothetical protein